jgi:hypothetical protein
MFIHVYIYKFILFLILKLEEDLVSRSDGAASDDGSLTFTDVIRIKRKNCGGGGGGVYEDFQRDSFSSDLGINEMYLGRYTYIYVYTYIYTCMHIFNIRLYICISVYIYI